MRRLTKHQSASHCNEDGKTATWYESVIPQGSLFPRTQYVKKNQELGLNDNDYKSSSSGVVVVLVVLVVVLVVR